MPSIHKILICLLFALTSATDVLADTTMQAADTLQTTATQAAADSAYIACRYAEAAQLYRAIPGADLTADIQYNIGNAEYRQKHVAAAILAYLRALRLDPGHDDAHRNLLIARAHLEDRFSAPGTPAVITWSADFVHSRSVATWVRWSLLFLILAFAAAALYLFYRRLWVCKTGFFLSLTLLGLFIITTIFAVIQRRAFSNDADAVITAASTQLYNSPSSTSRKQNVIHEGTTVTIIDDTSDGWILVSLPDATQGWMKANACEKVIP